MREVHDDGVGDEAGIFCRVDPGKVLVLDGDWDVRGRHKGKREGTLHVLTRRRVTEVDKICLEDIVAVHCCGVDFLVEFAGVERGVVKVPVCEEDGACGRW